MKIKICAIFIVASLLFGCLPAGAAVNDNYDYGYAYETLSALDMLVPNWQEEFDSEEVMTRGQFSTALVKVLYGYDVEEKTAGSMLMEARILSYAEDLRLTSKIEFAEAVKMLVVAIGGEVAAQEEGGYPTGYMDIAVSRRMISGVQRGESANITSGDAVTLLYNMLGVKMLSQLSFGEKAQYQWGEQTVLEAYRDIEMCDGRMTANGITALDDPDYYDPNKIIVDNVEYVTTDCRQYEELIGLYVDVYYQEDNGDRNLAGIVKSRKRSAVTLAIDVKDIEEVYDDGLEYYKDESSTKTTKIKFAPTMKVIYNHKAVSTYTPDTFRYGTGNITFIDVDGNGAYDVARVIEYENFIVDRISTSEKTVYNRFTYEGATKSIELDENSDDYIFRIESKGSEADFQSIPVGSVLSVAASKSTDNNVIDVIVSDNRIDSTLSFLSSNKDEVKIGETVYRVAKEYEKEKGAKGKWGSELAFDKRYDFLINAFGQLVGAKMKRSDAEYYAYLFGVGERGSVFDEEYALKVLTDERDWEVKELAEKIQLNSADVKLTEKACADSLTIGGKVNRQLIRVKENSKGEIAEIRTSVETDAVDETLLTKGIQKKSKYFEGNRSMQGEVYVDSDTKVFQVPDAEASEEIKNNTDYYSVISLKEDWYTYVAYDMSEYYVAKAITVLNSSAMGVKGNNILVKEVSRTVNSDGVEVIQLRGPYGSYENLTFMSADGNNCLNDVQVGDFLTLYTNAAGEVTGCDAIYRVSQGKNYGTNNQANWGASEQWGNGIIEAIDPEAGFMKISIAENQIYSVRIPSGTANLYDADREKFEVVDIGSLQIGDYIIFNMSYYSMGKVTAYRFKD